MRSDWFKPNGFKLSLCSGREFLFTLNLDGYNAIGFESITIPEHVNNEV